MTAASNQKKTSMRDLPSGHSTAAWRVLRALTVGGPLL